MSSLSHYTWHHINGGLWSKKYGDTIQGTEGLEQKEKNKQQVYVHKTTNKTIGGREKKNTHESTTRTTENKMHLTRRLLT
jgi:hypothetical protein